MAEHPESAEPREEGGGEERVRFSLWKRRSFLRAVFLIAVGGGSTLLLSRGCRSNREKAGEQVVVEGVEQVVVGTKERYPYSKSALLIFAAEEKRLFPDTTSVQLVEKMVRIANTIADRTAVRVLEHVREGSPSTTVREALTMLGSTEDGLKLYVGFIASELRSAGCTGVLENSLHDAVDPAKNPSGGFHLDCDLLCYTALHCAERHDMPLSASCAPYHMYLSSPSFPEFAIEMTEFRPTAKEELQEILQLSPLNAESRDRIGDGYFSSHAAQRAKYHPLSPDVEKRFGFYVPITDEEEFREIAVGNLLWEMVAAAVGNAEEIDRICERAEHELQSFKVRKSIPQAVYIAHTVARDAYVERWKGGGEGACEKALVHARRLKDVHSEYGQFITDVMDNDEQCLKALEDGDREKALPGIWKSLWW